MRVDLKIVTIAAAAFLTIGGLAAAETPQGLVALMKLLPPQPGNKACYVRSYDAAHLRAHPAQRITAMKFLLGVKTYDPKPAGAANPEDLYYYTFSMSVARRGCCAPRAIAWPATAYPAWSTVTAAASSSTNCRRRAA